ncbi:MAG: branched-chain amino acid ABC transporter permease, partial [Desulfobaccales bacterium]
MKFWRQLGFWLPLAIVVLWGATILLLGQDTMRETAFILLMSVALASSLNILLGYTGYVSFGHIVFFGLGGYTGFYLISEQGWPLYLAALAGGLLSGFIALLVGLAVLRLRGAYFALATIGINEAARAFVSNFSPFGGATGMFVNFSAYEKYGGAGQALWTTFTFLWITTIVVLLVSFLVRHSRFGLGLQAIREDEDAAMVMGVRAPQAKTIT